MAHGQPQFGRDAIIRLVRVSVVIPSYRRAEALSKCLEALEAQDIVPDEVIVVSRREDEATAVEVGNRRGSVRLVAIDVPDGHPGFVAALNAGVDVSRGEIVCLTDDDAEPRQDWVSRILSGFDADPGIGALGGRDWVFHGDVLEDGEEEVVGVVRPWGRTIGRHHLGVGAARDVDVLKGVNLSVRGDLIRTCRFDTRLLGVATEHHSELHLCLAIKRRGYRVVYDPAIAVDHRPRPRAAEARGFGPRQVRDSSHNETLALLAHLSPPGRAAHLLWSTVIGSRGAPGIAQSLRLALTSGDPRLDLLRANLEGRCSAIATRRGSDDVEQSVLAIADSETAMIRAEQLLSGILDAEVIAPTGTRRALAAFRAILTSKANSLYLLDIGKVTVPAALLGRLRGKRVIIDTGDAVFALARSLGDRSFLGLLLVGIGERAILRSAHTVVVRGRLHADYVPGTAIHVPDLAPPGAGPVAADRLRQELGLDRAYVVGLVGSLVLSERLGVSYGWDLIEALVDTDPKGAALIVGDGNGRGKRQNRGRGSPPAFVLSGGFRWSEFVVTSAPWMPLSRPRPTTSLAGCGRPASYRSTLPANVRCLPPTSVKRLHCWGRTGGRVPFSGRLAG